MRLADDAGALSDYNRPSDIWSGWISGQAYVALTKRQALTNSRRGTEHYLNEVTDLPVRLRPFSALRSAPVSGRGPDCGDLLGRQRLRIVLGASSSARFPSPDSAGSLPRRTAKPTTILRIVRECFARVYDFARCTFRKRLMRPRGTSRTVKCPKKGSTRPRSSPS